MNSYVPLSVSRRSYIESFCLPGSKDKKNKSNHDFSGLTGLDSEGQFAHGDFIQACNVESRYAAEIYGLKKYARYIQKHTKIVEKIKERNKGWLCSLPYHLNIRLESFRELLNSRRKKKKHRKGNKSLPKGRKKWVEGEARWDTEAAGELKYYETNPYAPGHSKSGVNLVTGCN